jgi:hypothetical protein
MAPQNYEEWVSTRFRKERVYSDEIDNIIRDGTLKLPERRQWQIYMSPQMQNYRAMKQMEAAAEGQANQRLIEEEINEQQRNSEPGPAIDMGFVANGVSRMNSMADALQQQMAGLERGHQLHAEGIALQSRQEVDRLAKEIMGAHERDRIAREAHSKLIDTVHADAIRRMEAQQQAAQTVNVTNNTTVNQSTTNEHMALLQQNLLQQQVHIQAAATEMMAQNREAYGQMAQRLGLTAQQMQDTVEKLIKERQPPPSVVNIDSRSSVNLVDARSVNVDARSVELQLQQMVDARSVTNVLHHQGGGGGGPPPPPSTGAAPFGPIRRGKDKQSPVYPFPYAKAIAIPPPAAIADQLAVTAGPAAPPQPIVTPPAPIIPLPDRAAPLLLPLEDAPKPRKRGRQPAAAALSPIPLPDAPQKRGRQPAAAPLAIEDKPRARTRTPRPTAADREAARAAKKAAAEQEKLRKAEERETRKRARNMAKAFNDAAASKEVTMNRPGRSASREKKVLIDPETLAAAAEAALGKKPKASSSSSTEIEKVVEMAKQKFPKGKAKAQPKKKASSVDVIRRVPVAAGATKTGTRGRSTGVRNKKLLDREAMSSAAGAITAA